MASIWLGMHLSLSINVAIKFMKPGMAEEPDYASFEAEARAAAQLRNEHIVHIYDHGVTSEGVPYLVMEEYLAGGPSATTSIAWPLPRSGRRLRGADGEGPHRGPRPPHHPSRREAREHHPHGGQGSSVRARKARRLRPREAEDHGDDRGRHDLGHAELHVPSTFAPRRRRTPASTCGRSPRPRSPRSPPRSPSTATPPEIMKAICGTPPPVPSSRNPVLTPAIDAWFAKACAKDPTKRFPSRWARGRASRPRAPTCRRCRSGRADDEVASPPRSGSHGGRSGVAQP